MILDVDAGSAVPTFEQVRAQLADMIVSGLLREGTRLPSIRQLASDLALAPGTVARAYRELENEGLVTSRVRHGTVVRPHSADPRGIRPQLDDAARAFALAALRLGASEEEAVGAVRAQLGGLASG